MRAALGGPMYACACNSPTHRCTSTKEMATSASDPEAFDKEDCVVLTEWKKLLILKKYPDFYVIVKEMIT